MPSILIQAILRAHNAKYEKLLTIYLPEFTEMISQFLFLHKIYWNAFFIQKKNRMKKNCK